MIEFGHQTAERFSEASAELEFETGMSVFFSHGAKKRYVGQVVWPKESMMVKGYETQRTDSFRYLTDGMKMMFKHVLADDSDAAINLAIDTIAAARKGEVPVRELIMSKSCKGRWDKSRAVWDFTKDYANPDSMVQVRAAKALIERWPSIHSRNEGCIRCNRCQQAPDVDSTLARGRSSRKLRWPILRRTSRDRFWKSNRCIWLVGKRTACRQSPDLLVLVLRAVSRQKG